MTPYISLWKEDPSKERERECVCVCVRERLFLKDAEHSVGHQTGGGAHALRGEEECPHVQREASDDCMEQSA